MSDGFSISLHAVFARITAMRAGQIVPGAGKHILIACMPKSASTYLAGILCHLPGMKEVVLTFGHGRREQELCPLECAIFHAFDYVAQAHVRYSRSTQEILERYSIFPVILVRNIFDCVVSMRDHLLHESLIIPQAYVPGNFPGLPAGQQYDFIIDAIVPWYANFLASWNEYRGPQLGLTYEKMIIDFPAAVANICDAAGMQLTSADIDQAIAKVNPKATRFNVGQVGRGTDQLSADQVQKVRKLFSFYGHIPGFDDVLEYGEPKTFTGRFRSPDAPEHPS